MNSLQDRLSATNNRPSGFDYLRIGLSIAVVAWHTVDVCGGRAAETAWWTGPWRPLIYMIIPAFFALSGFLVASSLERNDLPSFLTLRCLRIFPALVVEVFISAVLIGGLLTTLPAGDYFTDPGFRAYFLNVIGDIHYVLPGLFAGLPAGRAVNLQLWTIPFGLYCYIALTVLAVVGVYRRQLLFWALAGAFCIVSFVLPLLHGVPVRSDGRPPGTMIVLAFLFGVGLFALRRHIPWHAGIFSVCAGLCWLFLALPATVFLAPLPIAYVTVCAGLLNPPRNRVMLVADYSYGVYLYGFPVQQTIAYLFPAYRVWYVNLPASLLVTGVMAAFSWHFVEARVLRHKKAALAFVGRASARVTRRLRRTPQAETDAAVDGGS